MAQTIQFNENGLGEIKIGMNVSALENIESIDKYPNRKKLRLWFEDEYDYYYVKDSTLEIKDVGLVNGLFVVPNKEGNIIAIIIYATDKNFTLEKEMIKVFGNPSLSSESSIDSNSSNSKFFWKSPAGINIFLTAYAGSVISKVDLCNLDNEEHTPGIGLDVK